MMPAHNLRGWSLTTAIATFACAAIGAGMALALDQPVFFFSAAALLALLVVGRRLLTDPVPVLALFFLMIVNLDFVKLGPARLTLDVLVSALLLWALVVRCAMEGRPLLRDPIAVAYLLFLVLSLVSTVLSVSPLTSFKRWVRDLEYLIVFVFISSLAMAPRERRLLLGAILLSSLFPILAGFYGLIADVPAMLGSRAPVSTEESVDRIAATMSHPVTFSLYLAVVATLTLSLLLAGRPFRRRNLAPLLGLQVLALFFTFARGGWLAFAVAAAVLLWLRGHRKLLLIGGPLLFALLMLLVPAFRGRFTTLGESTYGTNSMLWRFGLWAHSLQVFVQRPIFGSGPGTFIEHVKYLQGYAAHQLWVNQLVEIGIVGLLGHLVLLITVVRRLTNRLRTPRFNRDPVVATAVAVFWGLLAASLSSNPYGLPPVIVYFWAIVGLALTRREPTA